MGDLGVGGVEVGRAHRTRLAKVVFGALDRVHANGQRPFVDLDSTPRRNGEGDLRERCVTDGQVGMGAVAERGVGATHVARRRRDHQAGVVEQVGRAQVEVVRPTGLRVQAVTDGDRRIGVLDQLPQGPSHQPVAGVGERHLGDRQLLRLGVAPVIATVTDAVRPRHELLSAPRLAGLVEAVAGHEVDTVSGQ